MFGDLLVVAGFTRHWGYKSNDFFDRVLPDGRVVVAGDSDGIGADIYKSVDDWEAGRRDGVLVADAANEADLLEKIELEIAKVSK